MTKVKSKLASPLQGVGCLPPRPQASSPGSSCSPFLWQQTELSSTRTIKEKKENATLDPSSWSLNSKGKLRPPLGEGDHSHLSSPPTE